MTGAGHYDTRWTLLVRTSNQENQYGQREETFTPSIDLWGNLEDLSGSERFSYGMVQSVVDAKIIINGLPSINSKDRIRNKSTNETYSIEGITKTKTETILEVVKQGVL
jgi:SPP1 family predicted phage head-tail adaptor